MQFARALRRWFSVILLLTATDVAAEPVSRAFYGARLEPRDKVLAGAGQDDDGWNNFAQQMEPGRLPVIYMGYISLKREPARRVRSLGQKLARLEETYPGLRLVPQIGLSMTKDGTPEEHYEHQVAAGAFDAQIAELVTALKELNRPVFLRIGYEFNASWNGYQPETYKQAFIRITKALREGGVWHATVWCASSPGLYWRYYPGDEWVDWWATDLFTPGQVVKATTGPFMDAAHARCKPVLIGESTAKAKRDAATQTSTNLNEKWDDFFGPYFEMLHKRKELKAFGYINWDWSRTKAWSKWGDARIETVPEIAQRWREEMKNPLFLTQRFEDGDLPREPSRTDCVPQPLPPEATTTATPAADALAGAPDKHAAAAQPAPPSPLPPPAVKRSGCASCSLGVGGDAAAGLLGVAAWIALWLARRRTSA